jgi:peroxiredoxin
MMRSDIAAGGTFPDYELTDHTQTIRKLSELQGDDPLILTLARGHYCPKDHQQHLQLAAFYPQIAVAYTRIVTMSTDHHHTSQEFRESVGAEWPFRPDWDLSAPGLREAWEAGDVSNFHGWDKRSPEDVAVERERMAR